MDIQRASLVYFSPTGTTRKVLKSIGRGLAVDEVETINLTLPKEAVGPFPTFSEEIVLLGAPVYGGRIPMDAMERFKKLEADGALAVPVVVYGNREFDDALLELKDLSIELGFVPVAAGAFIGEHSFATEAMPIANGRPDGLDLQKAVAFGGRVRDKVALLPSPEALPAFEVPGRSPYEGGALEMAIAPVTDENACTLCATCADVCPTGVIVFNGSVATDPKLCIRCSACIKECTEDARSWQDDMMTSITTWLHEECQARKEPEFFGVGV